MRPLIALKRQEAIAVLTLDRPERHNSLVPPFLEQMLDALETVESWPGVRVLLLQARGRSFSTGGDVKGFYDHRENLAAYAGEIVGLLNAVILALYALPIPIVTAVQGIVTGGSLGLVLASDVVLLAPQASFTPYYSIVGFSPDGGWTALLPALIGPRRVAVILFENQTISADQAVAWGLASRISPLESLQQAALETAQGIARGKAGSIRHTKALLKALQPDLASRLDAERACFIQQVTTSEARQGIVAFMEKRAG
jgi:enoyl-CoA hydratase/carnithine racemase